MQHQKSVAPPYLSRISHLLLSMGAEMQMQRFYWLQRWCFLIVGSGSAEKKQKPFAFALSSWCCVLIYICRLTSTLYKLLCIGGTIGKVILRICIFCKYTWIFKGVANGSSFVLFVVCCAVLIYICRLTSTLYNVMLAVAPRETDSANLQSSADIHVYTV